MFNIDFQDVEQILYDYHIDSKVKQISELQRYYYERNNPESKEVRLITKIELEDALALVIRFKNESDVTIELIENQSQFAAMMRKRGINTPYQYQTDGKFAKWYNIGGYDVIVTVEQFVENEIKIVDAATAKKTGELLAKMHTISEDNNIHIDNDVLFNPFTDNDLFDFRTFATLESVLEDEDKIIFDNIINTYNMYMDILTPLKNYPKYAVQGDISDCNLYLSCNGDIGIFDFNRSGDNILYCDAVMQAVFEARLMDYPEDKGSDFEEEILTAFLEGYSSVRAFSIEEERWYPYLCAIIDAFWSADIRWNKDSLLNAYRAGDKEGVHRWLTVIWERLSMN